MPSVTTTVRRRLWWVSDQPDESLHIFLAPLARGRGFDLNVYCDGNQPVYFMREFERSGDPDASRFLLDVRMPLPDVLRHRRFWQNEAFDFTFTGFALARWLIQDKNVAQDHIRVCSSNPGYERSLPQFSLNGLHCYPGWGEIVHGELADWVLA
jgi:hypothetical protein